MNNTSSISVYWFALLLRSFTTIFTSTHHEVAGLIPIWPTDHTIFWSLVSKVSISSAFARACFSTRIVEIKEIAGSEPACGVLPGGVPDGQSMHAEYV